MIALPKQHLLADFPLDGYLVSSGKKAYSFREAYERFNYCRDCHDNLMKEAWNRVRSSGSKNEDHVAPTAV